MLIETERLVLRQLVMADLDEFLALHRDPEVVRFVRALDRLQAAERLQANEQEWEERGHGMFAVLDRGSGWFLGRVGLKYWPQFQEIEAGWLLRRDAWGHGYTTEAGGACLDWGFATLPVSYITAMIRRENTRSIRVAQRLGFRPTRADVLLGDPVIVHSVEREDWASLDALETAPLSIRRREVEEIIALATQWAAGRQDVAALAVVGSWARGTGTIESDLDLVLLTESQQRYVRSDEWTRELGTVGSLRTIQQGVLVERRLATLSALELDITIGSRTWASCEPLDPGTERVVRDGLRILHDPNGALAKLTGHVLSKEWTFSGD